MKQKRTVIIRTITSLLLAAAMLIAMPGISVPAAAAVTARAAGEPSNPVHSHTGRNDGSDTATWSHVYFGSYPQTEVTGAALTAAITGASYDASGDAVVGSVKYRRIGISDTNSNRNFEGSTYRYFKWERIRWRVLSVNSSTLFVMADRGLDCKMYNGTAATWEGSMIRGWLNGDFYDAAFSSGEQNAIVRQTVANADNPQHGTAGGNSTQDKVYLLSIGEATNPAYGFCSDSNVKSASGRLKTSDYAYRRGAIRISRETFRWEGWDDSFAGNCWWWLRSPSLYGAAAVNLDGFVDMTGAASVKDYVAIVPALHINRSSDLWTLADDGGGSTTNPLASLKEQSKTSLDSYKSLSDYRAAQQAELRNAIAAGKTAIDAAADTAGVEAALRAAKTAMDGIKTDAQLRAEEAGGGNTGSRPSNPVHSCTKDTDESGDTDTSTWSCVYFGSYPQTEVTGAALTAAITGAFYDADGDAWVNGVKYRRLSKSGTNHSYNFGNSTYRYFKWERIRWRVLSVNSSTMFVVADKGMDCMSYNNELTGITWENSTLRSWLNGSFYNAAFSSGEQGAIVRQTVANANNPLHDTAGGNNTQDNIYLLSIGEATNPAYGFCPGYNHTSAGRRMEVSGYARMRGGVDDWWVRSPGSKTNEAEYLSGEGDFYASEVSYNRNAVRPALHINISSALWSMTDDGGSEGGSTTNPLASLKEQSKASLDSYKSQSDYRAAQQAELRNAIAAGKTAIDAAADTAGVEVALRAAKTAMDGIKTDAQLRAEEAGGGNTGSTPSNPVHHCTKLDDGSDITTWSYVYFGSYPQTEVAGVALTAAITGASYNASGDAWVDGVKYRRISKRDTNDDGYFGNSTYRYFKWERIKWRVMRNDGNTLFVVADKGIDCKDYNPAAGISITWEDSPLREWLNKDFYGAAFSSGEQNAIVRQMVVNEDNPYWGTEGGNDTQDNVYLLSIAEALNSSYGFCSDYSTCSNSRQIKPSDYAHARGAFRKPDGAYAGNGWWNLRSPGFGFSGSTSPEVAGVHEFGQLVRNGYSCFAFMAVRPALHINISPALWSMTDDGGSGGGGGSTTNPLASLKEQSKTSLDSYKSLSDYRAAQQAELRNAIAAGKTAIDAAADTAGVEAALRAAKTAMDGIKTDAQLRAEEAGAATWSISADGVLTILGTGNIEKAEGYDVFSVFPWYSRRNEIKSAVINWTGMTDLRAMFWGCENLTSVDLRGLNTSSVTIMDSMFSDCSSLTSLDVSGFDTGNVTNMSSMFSDCSSLTSLDVSGFDTGNVTDMTGMFFGCSGLTSLDVSGFDTRKVSDMMSVFSGCSGLTSLDVSGFDTGNVERMTNMFLDCSSLTSLDVSGFDTRKVSDMGCMFFGCSGLTSLDVSGFDTRKVSNMAGMFYSCSSLTSLDVSGFDTGNVERMTHMFLDCSSLTSLDVSGFDTGNVTEMSDMFLACSSLTSLKMPPNLRVSIPLPKLSEGVWKDADGNVVSSARTGLPNAMLYTRILSDTQAPPAPVTQNPPAPVTQTPSGQNPPAAVAGEALTSAGGGGSYTALSADTAAYEGTADRNAKTASVPDTITTAKGTFRVTEIKDGAFKGNKKLSGITIGRNITKIGKGAFEKCSKLKKITISTTKLLSVGKNALKGIPKNCKIKVPASKVKAYQKLFKKAGLPSGVKISK